MKTWLKLSFVVVFVLSLAFSTGPSNVQAFHETDPEGVAPGSWNSSGVASSEIPMNLVTTPGPAWLQLLANGLDLSAPARICHPFRGGQFGWTADIRMLDGDTWVKLPTTVNWTPTGEGSLIACATASTAGTYALFGYFTQPAIDPCANIEIYANGDYGDGTLDNRIAAISPAPPVGTAVLQTFINIVPAGAIWGDLANTGYTDALGEVSFGGTVYYDYEILESFTVKTKVNGCTQYLHVDYIEFEV